MSHYDFNMLKGGTKCGNNSVKNPIYSAPTIKGLIHIIENNTKGWVFREITPEYVICIWSKGCLNFNYHLIVCNIFMLHVLIKYFVSLLLAIIYKYGIFLKY